MAQPLVNCQTGSTGIGSPQQLPAGYKGGEHCSARGRCLRSAYNGMASPNRASPLGGGTGRLCYLVVAACGEPAGAWQPPTARAPWLGEQRVVPRRWSLCMERLQGMTARDDGRPLAMETKNPAPWMFATQRASAEIDNPQRRRPNGRGGKGSAARSVVSAYTAPAGDGTPQKRRLTR